MVCKVLFYDILPKVIMYTPPPTITASPPILMAANKIWVLAATCTLTTLIIVNVTKTK